MAVVIAQIATIVPRIAGGIAITIGQTRTIKEVRPASNRIAPATNHTWTMHRGRFKVIELIEVPNGSN